MPSLIPYLLKFEQFYLLAFKDHWCHAGNVNKSNHTLETMNAAENRQQRKRHIEVKLWKTVVNGTKGQRTDEGDVEYHSPAIMEA